MTNLFFNTLADLIEMTARLYGDWKSGVVDSGTTSTLVDDEREEPDDYFQNTTPVSKARIYATTDGDAPQGETRRATDWAHSTGTLTISTDKPFTVAPGAGDKYAILSELDWDEVKWAINVAIDMVAKDALQWNVNETTITIQEDTYEYALPTDFVILFRVTQEDGDGNFPYPIPPAHYKVIKGSTPKLHFYRFDDVESGSDLYYSALWATSYLSDGKVLRLEGLATPSKLDNDFDSTSVSPTYIMFQAASLLHSRRIGDPRYDSAYHIARAAENATKANIERGQLQLPQLPPDAKKCKD